MRSVKGSEGLDYGFKEKGKKALKITLLASTHKVIYFHSTEPDNVSDITAFTNLSEQHSRDGSIIVTLGDKGYIGREFQEKCLKNGFEIICPVKIFKNNHPSHSLSPPKKRLLKTHRCKIEHIFAQFSIHNGHLK